MFGNAENGFPVIKGCFIAIIADITLKHNLINGIYAISSHYHTTDKFEFFTLKEYFGLVKEKSLRFMHSLCIT